MKKKRKKARPLSLFDPDELDGIMNLEDLDLNGDLEDLNLDEDLKDIEIDVDLKDLNFDEPFQERERSLEYLRQSLLKSERELQEAERNYKKAQKDYYIRFTIEGIERIENKKVAGKRTTKTRKKKTRSLVSKN